MAARSPIARGYTLLELTVVIAIFAMLAVVVVPSVQSAMGVKLREEAGKVGGAVRAMYGEAALSGRTCRLVFDLEEASYWPECAAGKATIQAKEESVRGVRVEEKVDDLLSGDEDDELRRVEQRNAFSAFESGLAPRRTLPDGVEFQSVWTEHQEEAYVAGQAYLYFFPQGRTEEAYVYLTDGDDTYTIIVNPVSGRTRAVAERVELPR